MIPGALAQKTGGYRYDARMVEGLRARGWKVRVHELEGAFPEGDAAARRAMNRALSDLSDGALVLLDGLAMGALPEPIAAHAGRLLLVSLVHHPLHLETGLSDEERARLRAREVEALARCRGAVVTSALTAQQVAELGVPRARIRVAPPGTDPAPLARGPAAGAEVEFLCVASVVPRKGHDVLVEALAELREMNSDSSRRRRRWRCRCVGSLHRSPDFARRVRALIEAHGLSDRVELTGECSDEELRAHYDRASVFVLASHHEGFGMVLTEALARGLPVVATTGGAIPDTVPKGAGLLVPPGDAPALARALRAFLSPEVRERAAAEARSAARTLPDWERATETLEGALRAFTQESART
ncbi:MAG: glycosyltransferase [Gemmatimonadales bacterium]|nr:MAG: glycosyltransferase [Gemmatimonadales bacterium]